MDPSLPLVAVAGATGEVGGRTARALAGRVPLRVLARDAGEGTAEVLLDWVTPAYRDFSPGEFVFRDSGLFSGRGVRRVLTPAGMKNPYYGRIGFRAEGDRWVLDVEPAGR